MKLFTFKKKEKVIRFRLKEEDRLWVDENYLWLISSFGLPKNNNQQILFSKDFFPHTFENEKIEHIISDLSKLLQLGSAKKKIETISDIRDSVNMPYEIEEQLFESDIECTSDGYKIYIANSLAPNRILYNLIYNCIVIKSIESQVNFETGEDTALFIFIAGVFWGFGILLYQNLLDIGYKTDGFWETKWNFSSDMPIEIMSYCIALNVRITKEDIMILEPNLSKELFKQVKTAFDYIDKFPSSIITETELKANALAFEVEQLFQSHKYQSVFPIIDEILILTKDNLLIADVYEKKGYALLRNRQYEDAIEFLEMSLNINPDSYSANDNIAYALLKTHRLEEGLKYINKSFTLAINDIAYTYRNLAMYHLAKGEIEQAREKFKTAFDAMTKPVDLLEYEYSDFLAQQGEKEESEKYLQKSIEKGEPEALIKILKDKE